MSATTDLEACYAIDDLEAMKALTNKLRALIRAAEANPQMLIQLTRAMRVLVEQEHQRSVAAFMTRVDEQVRMFTDITGEDQ